jgi:hypothetical protein
MGERRRYGREGDEVNQRGVPMKKSRGGRMAAAKKRAAKKSGGKGKVAKRKVGRKIMKT